MRTKILLIAVFLILGVNAIAQELDKCTLPPPVFCQDLSGNSNRVQDRCKQDIQTEYIELLEIAKKNLKFLSPEHTDYGRCVEENDDKVNALKESNKIATDSKQLEFLNHQLLSTLRSEVSRLSEPLPIETPWIHLNENQKNYRCFVNNEQKYLTDLGTLVARLEIKYSPKDIYASPVRDCPSDLCKNNSINNSLPRIDYAQWGTAIQLTPRVVLTSCHVLESLVDEHGNLSLDQGQELYVDFGERDDQFTPGSKVEKVIWVSDDEGFDIALLEIDEHKLRDGMKVIWGQKDGVQPQEVAVIGYPDFHHPVDPCSDAAFSSYKTQGDAKFVSLGCAFPPPEACKKDSEKAELAKKDPALFATLFHTATTTMGESGGILVARDLKGPSVIGVHVCCSYSQKENQYNAPPSKLKCANLKRTQYNQAISVCSLFKQFKDPRYPQLLNTLKALGYNPDNNACPKSPAASQSK